MGRANSEGDAKELAATPRIPAMSPVIPLEIQTAPRGRLSGIVTPYRPGSVTPANSADTPEDAASCFNPLFLDFTATAKQEAPCARLLISIHMFCAYWGFLFLSFHLGIHWNMILGMTGKLSRKKSKLRVWFLRLTGFLIAAYGVYALFHREIPSYLFLQTQFVFFDFEEPLVFFLLDYLTVMGLFVFSGHYAGQAVRRLSKSRKRAKS